MADHDGATAMNRKSEPPRLPGRFGPLRGRAAVRPSLASSNQPTDTPRGQGEEDKMKTRKLGTLESRSSEPGA